MPKHEPEVERAQIYCASLTDALAYAERGFFIVPMTPQGNSSRPLVLPLQATRNSDIIRKWWRRWPNSIVGCVLGKSGIIILEINGKEGHEALARIEAESGLSAPTFTASAGGSTRRYYKCAWKLDGDPVREIEPGLRIYHGKAVHVLPRLAQPGDPK